MAKAYYGEVREVLEKYHIDGFEPAVQPDCEALAGELIDNFEHPILPPVVDRP